MSRFLKIAGLTSVLIVPVAAWAASSGDTCGGVIGAICAAIGCGC